MNRCIFILPCIKTYKKCSFHWLILVILLFWSYAGAEAQQLKWENEELKFNVVPNEAVVVGLFRFKNVGKSEAKITSVTSSCSCTQATANKAKFAPGESGEITATFTVGARTGLQEKIILVESNDPERPKTVLKMKVTIPEIVQIRPTFLFWSPQEGLTSKEISVQIMNDFPVKTVTVQSSNPSIMARVEPSKAKQEYRILVTPSQTEQPLTALLSIKTDYPPENPKTFYVNVRVQPQK